MKDYPSYLRPLNVPAGVGEARHQEQVASPRALLSVKKALLALIAVPPALWWLNSSNLGKLDTLKHLSAPGLEHRVSYNPKDSSQLSGLINSILSKPILSHDLKAKYHKELEGFFEKIDEFKASFDSDRAFLANLRKTMGQTGLSRLSFVSSYIEKASSAYIPEGALKYLKPLILGIAAQENRFKLEGISKDSAMGFWQLRPETIKDNVLLEGEKKLHSHQLKIPNMKSYKDVAYKLYVATPVALNHLMRRIPVLIKNELEFIRSILDMKEEEYYKFFALVVANAYNTGQGAMKNFLEAFREHLLEIKLNANSMDMESQRMWKVIKNKPAELLFEYFARFARKNFANYGEEAYEYVKKLMAGAMSIKGHEKVDLDLWWARNV